MIKESFRKVFDGLLYGVGFSLPFCAAFYFAMDFSTSGYMESSEELSTRENYGFTVVKNRIEKIEESQYVVGSLMNNNETTVRGVSLEAEFFDFDGEFINKCTGSIGGKFKPDEQRNFKLKCSATESKHNHYTVRVTGAYDWEY